MGQLLTHFYLSWGTSAAPSQPRAPCKPQQLSAEHPTVSALGRLFCRSSRTLPVPALARLPCWWAHSRVGRGVGCARGPSERTHLSSGMHLPS